MLSKDKLRVESKAPLTLHGQVGIRFEATSKPATAYVAEMKKLCRKEPVRHPPSFGDRVDGST